MRKNTPGWLSIILALLALSQKMGGYENKSLAVALLVLAVIAFLGFIVAWTREKSGTESSASITQESHGPNSPNVLGDNNRIG